MFNTDSKCKHTVDRKMAINSCIKDNTSQSLSHGHCNMKHVKRNMNREGNVHAGVAAENSSEN